MNLLTAAKMLVLLENSAPSGNDDDAYFVIQRLLHSEIRKAHTEDQATASDMRATYTESLLATSDKVRAIRMYRERTKRGLYEAKVAVEEGARLIEQEEAKKILNNPYTVSEVTSCG